MQPTARVVVNHEFVVGDIDRRIIGPIRTEPGGPAWRQAIFHPFAQTARLARGQVLRSVVSAPDHGADRFGSVPALDAGRGAGAGLRHAAGRRTRHAQRRAQRGEHRGSSGRGDRMLGGELLRVALPPASWHAIRLAPVPR